MSDILFTNVRIVDPELATVSELVDVKVEGGRIAGIGPDLDDECDTRIDTNGRYSRSILF